MNKVFKDGSKCIFEEGEKAMRINNIIHLRLGKGLNFIDGIRLVDGTFIQNMQYEMDVGIPTPGEIAEKLSQFGAICYYDKPVKNPEKAKKAI